MTYNHPSAATSKWQQVNRENNDSKWQQMKSEFHLLSHP